MVRLCLATYSIVHAAKEDLGYAARIRARLCAYCKDSVMRSSDFASHGEREAKTSSVEPTFAAIMGCSDVE